MQSSSNNSSSDMLFGRQFYPIDDDLLTDPEADPFDTERKLRHLYNAPTVVPHAPPPLGYYPYHYTYGPQPYPYRQHAPQLNARNSESGRKAMATPIVRKAKDIQEEDSPVSAEVHRTRASEDVVGV